MDSRVDNEQFNIIHWNCRSILPKLNEFMNFLNKFDVEIDIILFNETWLDSHKIFQVPGFNIIRRDSDHPHGGIAVAINSKYTYTIKNTYFSYHFQNLVISVQIGHKILDILCLYCPPPPNGKFNINNLTSVYSHITSKDFLIVGDFNAHHVSWGCRKNDQRGNLIYSFADNHKLVCLNDHTVTTFPPLGQEGNVLDLVFASPSISSSCAFSVLDDLLSSNHYPLLVNVFFNVNPSSHNLHHSSTPTPDFPPLSQINFNKVDWSQFTELCINEFSSFSLSEDPQQNYNNIIDIITNILLTFPKKLQCYYGKRKSMIWWNETCDKAVRQAKIALQSYKTYPTAENYVLYKYFNAKKKRTIAEQKLQSWTKLCSSFNRMTSSKIVWDYMRRFKLSKLNHTKTKSNFLENPTNASKYLDKISSLNTVLDKSQLEQYFSLNGSSTAQWLTDKFEINEFNAALEHKKNTSPGPDFIPYLAIKNLPPIAKNILLDIYNQIWLNKCVPPSWKIQYTVPILKLFKDPNCLDAYRPISLTSCFSKLFETMLKNRLEWFIESHAIIPVDQYGFRKGKSTMDNLSCLVGDIRNNFRNNKYTLAVFLDIKGAFDNIDHCYLIKSLSSLGIPGHVLLWLYNFLNNRKVCLKIRNKIYGPRSTFKGTPQGAVLSPLVFILSLVNFMENIPTSVKYLFFADDLVVYVDCLDLIQGELIMNNCLKYLSDLLNNHLKLEVNVNKSSVILFSKNGFLQPHIFYNDLVIPVQRFIKYVGVVLDFELSWKHHINHVCRKAELGLNIMKSLAGLEWGSDPKVLKTIYISIVRSHFDYGCMFFGDAASNLLRKLDVLQNKALRIISGGMMSSPINSLEVEAGIVPLFIRRAFLIDKYCLKLVSRDNAIISRYLEYYNTPNFNLTAITIPTSLSDSIAYLNFEFQDVVYWSSSLPCFTFDFHCIVMDVAVSLKKFENKYDFLEYLETKQNFVKIYTDGSKTLDRTSFAFYDSFLKIGKVFNCNQSFSIFSAEILAIVYALDYLLQNCYETHKRVLILSDSMSALQALCNKSISASTNYLIFTLKQSINRLQNRDVTIEFCWVPGHSGILGNELVDTLAKSSDNVMNCNYKVPYTDLTLFVKKLMLQRWTTYLDTSRNIKGKWLAEVAPVPSTKAWFEKYKTFPGRNFFTTLSRLRIGHCRFPAHLSRLNLNENATCKYCNNNFCDLDHIFFVCPNFGISRLLFICLCQDILNNTCIPHTVQGLLKYTELYPAIYSFIHNTTGKL